MSVNITRDLRSAFGGARDQGQRPTCLAFAVSDAHGALYQPFRPFSPEYLYYHAIRKLPGSALGEAISEIATAEALLKDGQPLESACIYQAQPATSVPVCQVFRRSMPLSKECFDSICKSIDNGRPVVVCLWISDAFYMPDKYGVVVQRATSQNVGVHAVIAVAHGTTTRERCVLVRNSWGLTWGVNGHAFLEKSYLDGRITSTSILV
jgi:hypothetical protein